MQTKLVRLTFSKIEAEEINDELEAKLIVRVPVGATKAQILKWAEQSVVLDDLDWEQSDQFTVDCETRYYDTTIDEITDPTTDDVGQALRMGEGEANDD
jgi:hypothetical protein